MQKIYNYHSNFNSFIHSSKSSLFDILKWYNKNSGTNWQTTLSSYYQIFKSYLLCERVFDFNLWYKGRINISLKPIGNVFINVIIL